MELKVLNIKGKETGRKVKLSADVFGIEPNDHAIYLDVKSHLSNKRQGTHKSKERAEIREVLVKLKSKKVLELLVLVVSKIRYSRVEDECLDLLQEITVKRLIKK